LKNDAPKGMWGRSRSVLAMAANVASKEIKHRVLGASELATRIEQARVMAESLGRLKGAFMKAGQLLSIDASDFLPPEATEILAKLQGHAEPVDFAQLRAVLDEELGAERVAQLVDLDPLPAASASIGQVHRAQVGGTPVAVKIQYPGIADSIDSDIALLEKVGASFLTLSRREIDLHDTFAELKTVLHLEADYLRERRFLERFGELLAGDDRFEVPRSFPELSTERVLTMSWAEGMPLATWIRAEPPREERQALGRAVLDLYCLEFFVWGLVQTDPNFGNFLVRGERIVLLDFGATVEYDADFRRRYVQLLRALRTGDRDTIVTEAIDFGLFDPRESEETRGYFADMLRSSVEPFDPDKQPFLFRDEDYAARSREVIQRFTRSLRYSAPPRQLLFLHRKLGGIFQLLRRLDVELDLRPYWDRMVANVT
jgi:aarF domain-containing kinase